MIRVILMGPAGSGKDTQSYFISQKYGATIFSTGSILRDKINDGDELSKKINDLISRGNLVPDEIIESLLFDKIENCKNGFILDGFPRNIKQAVELDKFLEKIGEELDAVILLNVPRATVIKRISGRYQCSGCKKIYNKFFNPTKKEGICDICGNSKFITREDDLNLEAINKRLDIYESLAKDIKDFYNKKNLIYSIDGVKSIEEISQDIDNILTNLNVNK